MEYEKDISLPMVSKKNSPQAISSVIKMFYNIAFVENCQQISAQRRLPDSLGY